MTIALHGFPDWQRSLTTADLVSLQISQLIPSIGTLHSARFDMRPYQSVRVHLEGVVNGVPTNYNQLILTLAWYDQAAGGLTVWQDIYTIYANGQGGAFAVGNGVANFQDSIRGPFLEVFVDNDGPNGVNATLEVMGSSKILPGPSFRNEGSIGSVFIDDLSTILVNSGTTVLAPGAIATYNLRTFPGRVSVRMVNIDQPITCFYRLPNGLDIESRAPAVGTIDRYEMIFPRTPINLLVQNGGAANGSHSVTIIAERPTW